MKDKYAALRRVLSNLSKAVLKIRCTFNFLDPRDEDVGYTFRRSVKGTKTFTEVAEIYLNRDHEMFDGLDEARKNVAAFGVATHEMLHQKFTDFKNFEQTARKMPYPLFNLFKTVFNICEDGRIEYFANQVFGGKALSSLNFVKKLTWDKSPDININSHPVCQIMNALIQYGDMGRVKGDFSDDDTRETFLYCSDIYDKAIICTKCSDCLKLSEEMSHYLLKKYSEVPDVMPPNGLKGGGSGEDAKQQQNSSRAAASKQQNRNATKQQMRNKNASNKNTQNSQNDNKTGSGSSSKSKEEENEDNGNGNSNENNKTQNASEDKNSEKSTSSEGENGSEETENSENGNSGEENDAEQDEQDESSSSGKNNSDSQNETDGSNSGESFENETGNNGDDTTNNGSDKSNDNSDEEGQEVTFDEYIFDEEDVDEFSDELEAKLEAAEQAIEEEIKTSEGDVYTFKIDDAECSSCTYRTVPCDENVFRMYQQYADTANVSSYADELAKDMSVILKTRPTGWERNKSGKLNIKRWMDPNFNSPYIFDKRLSNESSIAVSILIDESGSMDCSNRIGHVRQMASVLAEAFLQLGIKFNILGHTGGECRASENTVREYSDFDSDVFEQVYTIQARDYNYDGASIKVATDKLAKREERNKLMFVLTDGASHNVANTEFAIRDANKVATVIGVALACGRDREVIEKMYGQNFVMVNSMDELMDTIIDKLKEVSCQWS